MTMNDIEKTKMTKKEESAPNNHLVLKSKHVIIHKITRQDFVFLYSEIFREIKV